MPKLLVLSHILVHILITHIGALSSSATSYFFLTAQKLVGREREDMGAFTGS